MTLTVEWADFQHTLVAAVTGDIDAGTTPTLRERIDAGLRDQPTGTVVLDLSGVHFLDSAGLALLVELASRCDKAGQEFQLVCTTRGVLRPLQITGLDKILTVLTEQPHHA
ncbi:MAG TPA: STAS domain-containing protein [Amycolatopsis sp.]|nr:STAS domain-containing protein [Amycolatopsis sp.]